MQQSKYTKYARPVGLNVLHRLATQGRRIFTTNDFAAIAAESGLSRASTNLVIHELSRAQWIESMKRGLYAIRAPELSQHAIHPFVIATHFVVPSAISGWSALRHHGFTDQVPHLVTAITTRPLGLPRKTTSPGVREQSWEVLGVRVAYSTVTTRRFIGIEETWVDEIDRAPITDRERTVLDLFLSPRKYGGISEGLSVLRQYIRDLDIARLISYAGRIGTTAPAKRLGWMLTQLGIPQRTLAPLRSMPTSAWHLLDPGGSPLGELDPTWNLRVNI